MCSEFLSLIAFTMYFQSVITVHHVAIHKALMLPTSVACRYVHIDQTTNSAPKVLLCVWFDEFEYVAIIICICKTVIPTCMYMYRFCLYQRQENGMVTMPQLCWHSWSTTGNMRYEIWAGWASSLRSIESLLYDCGVERCSLVSFWWCL